MKSYRDLGCAIAIVGGNWNNSGNAGLWNWNLNNSSANTNVNIGGRLIISRKLKLSIAPYLPYHLVKIQPQRARFSKSLLKHLEANENTMKRFGYLYPKIVDIETIKTAMLKASLGKRNRKHIKDILDRIDYYACQIQKMLVDKSYAPSPYTIKKIFDGAHKKERVIYKPRFYPDQIIHWALMLALEPVMMRGMYAHTCGSVPGRGTSYGQKVLRKKLDEDYKGTKYCLKMDITKFYPSIDKNLLRRMFRRVIKDKDCLWLIDVIIDSAEYGLPIGNYTSQWFSNFFLQDLDHFVKEKLGVKHYIRYVDDLVILGGNKKKLHQLRKEIEKFLIGKNLKLKHNWQVFLVSKRFIDFLGLKFYREKTTLRKANSLRIRRRMAKIAKKKFMNFIDACAVVSYWGWIKRSDSFKFYQKYIGNKISLERAKGVIRNHAKVSKDSRVWTTC